MNQTLLQPYNFWADWLLKFDASSEWIQALWIVTLASTVLGVAYVVSRSIREIIDLRHYGAEQYQLVCGVVRDSRGRWMFIRPGQPPQEVDWTKSLELINQIAPTGQSRERDRNDP